MYCFYIPNSVLLRFYPRDLVLIFIIIIIIITIN
jgi:hypothetical protein